MDDGLWLGTVLTIPDKQFLLFTQQML